MATTIAIIGAGIISSDHAQAIAGIDGFELVAVMDVDEAKTRDFASRFPCAAYTDLQAMLAEVAPDAVIVAVPHGLHREVTVACLESGAHVLVEKPMATTVEDCTAMIEAARACGRVLMVGHVHQYMPAYREAARLIAGGEFGQVVSITDVRNAFYFADTRPRWFLDPVLGGGGITINLGAHSIDRIQLLAGSEVTEVYGAVGFRHPGARVEGDAHALLRLENGVLASMVCVGYHVPTLSRTEVYCTDGALRCGYDGLNVSRGGEPFQGVDLGERRSVFVPELEDFLAAIRGERPVAITGEYGRGIISTIQRIYAGTARSAPKE